MFNAQGAPVAIWTYTCSRCRHTIGTRPCSAWQPSAIGTRAPPDQVQTFARLGGSMARLLRVLFVLALCQGLNTSIAVAQNVYAAIHGTVTDVSGAVISGAKVTVLNTSTGISTEATTDTHGYYTLP